MADPEVIEVNVGGQVFECEVGSPLYHRLRSEDHPLDGAPPPVTDSAPEDGRSEEAGAEEGHTKAELKARSREELNELAAELGIEGVEELPNKGAVIDAILEAA